MTEKIQNWNEKTNLSNPPWSSVSYYSIGSPLDKTSPVLVPLAASAGVSVPKILAAPPWRSFLNQKKSQTGKHSFSDKLQAIPGFQTQLRPGEIREQLSTVRAAFFSPIRHLYSSSGDMSPQVCSSLVYQDLLFRPFFVSLMREAKGSVFDIQVGEGSFLKSPEKAKDLVHSIKKVCTQLNTDSSFFLSDMTQPLGHAFGDSLELRESLEILKARGPLDVLKLCLELGTEMLLLAKRSINRIEAKEALKTMISKGEALEKLREIIRAQRGNPRILDDYSLLPTTVGKTEVRSPIKGFISTIKMKKLFFLYLQLREKSGPKVCHSVGFLVFKKKGDWVEKGEILAEVHFDDKETATQVGDELRDVFHISETPPGFQPLIIERIKT